MSSRGFRKIVVKEQSYKWRFQARIQICPEGLYNNKLEIDFGYYDVWLYMNDWENRPADYEPKIITPAFVSTCIVEALNLGWNPSLKHGLFKVIYREQTFKKE